MPARSRLDLATRPEEGKPHPSVCRMRTSPSSASDTSPAREEPRHSSSAATSVARPGQPWGIEIGRQAAFVNDVRLRAAVAQEGDQLLALGATLDVISTSLIRLNEQRCGRSRAPSPPAFCAHRPYEFLLQLRPQLVLCEAEDRGARLGGHDSNPPPLTAQRLPPVLTSRLAHEQHVALRAPCDRLVNRAAEQALEEAVLAATDYDQVGVALVGHLEQTLGRIAQLDYVPGLELACRKRRASALELLPSELLRLGRRRLGFGQRHRSGRRDRPRDGSEPHWRLERRSRRRSVCRHAYDDKPGGESLGDLSRAPERPLGRIGAVVDNDDRLHRWSPPLAVPFLLVLLHHCAGSDLLLTAAIAALLLRLLLDVLVQPLLLVADAAQVLLLGISR